MKLELWGANSGYMVVLRMYIVACVSQALGRKQLALPKGFKW